MYQRPLSIAILALCGSVAATDALALGFGRIPESLAYGQALDLAVPLRLDPGESLSPACLDAEINLGEKRLPKAALRLQLDGMGQGAQAARVRIRSNVVVHEPVVIVSLSVGCTGPVSRRFVLLADPPVTSRETAPPVAAETVRAVADASRGLRSHATPGRATVPATMIAKGNDKPTGATRAVAVQSRAANSLSAARPGLRGDAPAASRLKLEDPDALLQVATVAVAAQDAALAGAAQAVSAAQAAASAAEQRMAGLEQNLQVLRADAAAQRAAMDPMRSRLRQADDQTRLGWALLALAVGLAAIAVWLGLRLRALQREQRAGGWQGAAAAPEAQAVPLHAAAAGLLRVGASPVPGAGASGTEPVQAAAPTPPLQSVARREDLMPPSALTDEALTRPLSVDELIDLEQQAEFFLVLGEEGAAIDLLMGHLRSSGDMSPLPYLKLLEIHRRRQDRESYERVRQRFNRHFDALAPAWDADPELGRDLQDYPAVLATLQQAWHSPPQAMAELENLLFRKHGGELFELPAYRDVLSLFAVARDLHRQPDDRADVDLLLPLHLGRDLEATAVQSIFDRLDHSGEAVGASLEERCAAPIDLDLDELAQAYRSASPTPVVVPFRRGRG